MIEYKVEQYGITVQRQEESYTSKASLVDMDELPMDTTGAGDAFVSGFLYCVNKREQDLASITLEEAADIAKFASVSGGLAASDKGAMTALPTLSAVNKIITGNGSSG